MKNGINLGGKWRAYNPKTMEIYDYEVFITDKDTDIIGIQEVDSEGKWSNIGIGKLNEKNELSIDWCDRFDSKGAGNIDTWHDDVIIHSANLLSKKNPKANKFSYGNWVRDKSPKDKMLEDIKSLTVNSSGAGNENND